MLCLLCAEPRVDAPGSTCPVCGTPLQPLTSDTLEALLQRRLREKISTWRDAGLLGAATATQLAQSLSEPSPAPPAESALPVPPPAPPPTLEQRADALAARLAEVEDWRPTWGQSFFRALEDSANRERAAARAAARREREGDPEEDGLDLASDSGQALFRRVDASALGGLEAMAALDADGADTSETAPKLHEYVWWFLGAVLVLGGSLMGVREAWRALGGVPRQLLVTGALFAYHAAFVGLGVFLSRRSAPVGRVLASIGVVLLPVVFVALSSLVALEPVLGGAVAAGFTGLALLTLRPTARLLYGASPVSLALALVPSLLAGLPLMGLDEAPGARTLGAFVGVAALAVSGWRIERTGMSRAALSVLLSGLYGALSLAVFAVASAPDGFDALTLDSPLLGGMRLWLMALATVVAGVALRPRVHEAHPAASPVVETIAHAVVGCGALVSAAAALSLTPGAAPDADLLAALTPLVAALAFFVLEPQRRALLHPGALSLALASVLLVRLRFPGEASAWMVGPAAVGAGLLLVARVSEPGRARDWLLGWGVVLSLAGLALTSWLTPAGSARTGPTLVAGAVVAVCAHLAGGRRWKGLHYLGGLGAAASGLAAIDVFAVPAPAQAALLLLGVLAALYGAAGLLQEGWKRADVRDTWPLDDVSLALAALGAVRASGLYVSNAEGLLPYTLATGSGVLEAVWGSLPALVLAGLLLLRTGRDGSRLVSALAAWAFAAATWVPCALVLLPGRDGPAPRALHLAAVVLGFSALAGARQKAPGAPDAPPRARRLLGWLRLPFPASGRALYTDGFATVGFVAALGTLAYLGVWTLFLSEADRPQVVLASLLLTGSASVAFLSRGYLTWRLRGSVGALAAVGVLLTFTAVLNRLGRPLPPDVVALRLTGIGLALGALAFATRRFGPALGRLLDNPSHGPLYARVPFTGVAGLGLLLAVEPLLVGGPQLSRAMTVVPPLFLLGAALLVLVLARALRLRELVGTALLLGLPGAALWVVHGTVFGHVLVALDPPGGRWVRAELLESARNAGWLDSGAWLPVGETVASVWYRAIMGVAVAGLLYAGVGRGFSRVEARHPAFPGLLDTLQEWAGIAAGIAFLAAFFQPGRESALLVTGTGLLLLGVGRKRKQGRQLTGLGPLLIVHALAHREPRFASWPGPTLALVGLGAVALGPRVARWRKADPERARIQVQFGALFYGLHAMLYALATGGEPARELAMPWVFGNALIQSVEARWMRFEAVPVTAALLAATLFVGAAQWKGALARVGAAWATLMAGAAAVTGLAVALMGTEARRRGFIDYGALSSSHGPVLALGFAGVVVLAHLTNRGLRAPREDMAGGLAWGRDAWLLGTGGVLALVAAQESAGSGRALPGALAALGLTVAVALHAAWREHTGRHVYFVQVAAVGVYALVRALVAQDLRPEHDALFALVLGFVLVGVTVLARRAGIPPVERATRRFAALLPLGMALVLPSEATGEAALLAGGSSLMYAALGAVERSRLFGALAAVACNAALLVGALSLGVDGVEIFLAPLGLLLLMLGQLFARGLPHAARNAVRLVGGLLLYVPAAAKVALRLGLAEDGTYAVVFGAVCLLGVVVGMVLRIRAYLALGTLFLTLDVVATLLHAGLRDHRVGFAVMTLTGLLIVGGRVLATLHRQWLDLMWRRASVALRGWD